LFKKDPKLVTFTSSSSPHVVKHLWDITLAVLLLLAKSAEARVHHLEALERLISSSIHVRLIIIWVFLGESRRVRSIIYIKCFIKFIQIIIIIRSAFAG
jgi:hypothetical protein